MHLSFVYNLSNANSLSLSSSQAEKALQLMRAQGYKPREYAFCGLIAAYSLAGMHEAALKVRARARSEGLQVGIVWLCEWDWQ